MDEAIKLICFLAKHIKATLAILDKQRYYKIASSQNKRLFITHKFIF